MSKYRTDFTESELENGLGKHKIEADRLLCDSEEMESLAKKAKKLLDKIKNIPVIGALVDEIITMIELFQDYARSEYRAVPLRIMVSMVALILYLLSPVDLIPDVIPVLGFLDDAAVISLVISLGAGAELSKYRKWKEKRDADELNDIITDYEVETCNNNDGERCVE